ncbi:STP1 protein, partial [Plasmodium malariae]
WQFYEVTRLPEFKRIENEIKQKTISLSKKNDKDEFRKGCLNLADYLISENKPPQYYTDYKVTWKGALNHRLSGYYRNLEKYGGCPLILEEKDKNILELKYEEVDFCDKRKKYFDEIRQLKEKLPNNSDTYSSKCNEYNEWIVQKKNNFDVKSSLFGTCYENRKQKKKRKGSSEFICDLKNSQTFQKISDCPSPNKLSPRAAVSESTHKDLQSQVQEAPKASYAAQVPPNQGHLTQFAEKAKDKEISPDSQEIQKELQPTPPQELPSNVQISTSETPNTGSEPSSTGDMQVKPSQYSTHVEAPPSEASTFYKPPKPVSQSSEIRIDAKIVRSPGVSRNDSLPSVLPMSSKILGPAKNLHNNSISLILTSILVIIIFSIFIKYALIGRLKKKNKIKRRQMKFLRILIPSLYDKKSKFLTHYHTESLLHDEESIIKKLKIYEHDIKNLNIRKQKKDRFKTIIEVHMEVLEEFRNEEWEHKKGEFLELCLEMFAEEEYKTYPNLSNGQLIMENTKSINDIEKQKILCNKWIKEHRNISEKLKKTIWFNYLKNEWKKEKAFIKNSEELKVNFSNKIQKDSFSEGEKDLWREWISKKHMIIEQYMEQELYEEMTQELLNTIDDHENEEIKNNTLLLNTEELQKESYEELYNYLKKKLIAKLCILVFMMVLEDCQKENLIENEELHLDRSINDWKTGAISEIKSDVTKEITAVNDVTLENRENRQTPAHIEKKSFRQEIEDWVREDDTLENSIYNENSVE